MAEKESETKKLVERAFALRPPAPTSSQPPPDEEPKAGEPTMDLLEGRAETMAVDYRTAYGGMQEMTQELRALIIAADDLHDRHERGALAALADHIEALAKLYADTLRLMANPPVL